MCPLGPGGIILAMTRPVTSSKVVLLEDARTPPPAPGSVPLRRFRLARLRFDNEPAESEQRFEYLKRVYD